MQLFQTISAIFTFTFSVCVIANNTYRSSVVNAANLSTLGLPLEVPPTTSSLISKSDPFEEYFARENASIVDSINKTGLTLDCREKNWRITVTRDFFGRGVPFSPSFIRLGEDPKARGTCTPQTALSSPTEMVLSADLQDCGSKSEVNGEWLIYSNKLVFSPAPVQTLSGILIQRGVATIVPIECHYKRRQTVIGEPLTPTWLPMTSTIHAAGLLDFSLKVMGEGWRFVRSSPVFLQGEPVFLEAEVSAPLHPALRVYVDYCVATLNSEPLSKPRYEFIVNRGCLVDSLVPHSNSQFAPRARENSLRFSIQTFHFTRDPQDQTPQQEQVFISCHLRAVPRKMALGPLNKACSFHLASFSWRSVDGDDADCSCCATGGCHRHSADLKAITNTSMVLPITEEKTNTGVGPLHFMPVTQWKGEFSIIGDPASGQ